MVVGRTGMCLPSDMGVFVGRTGVCLPSDTGAVVSLLTVARVLAGRRLVGREVIGNYYCRRVYSNNSL